MLAHQLRSTVQPDQTTHLLPTTALHRTKLTFSACFTASLQYRLRVLSRFCAAVLGGYLLCASLTAFLPLILPLKPTDAVLFTLSLSVLMYAISFISAFYFQSLKYIWSFFIGGTLLFVGLSFLLQGSL